MTKKFCMISLMDVWFFCFEFISLKFKFSYEVDSGIFYFDVTIFKASKNIKIPMICNKCK